MNYYRLLILSISLLTSLLASGQSSMSGKVVDANTSESLINAYVINISTGDGTITNQKGFFSIQYETSDTLSFKYLGYEEQLIPAGQLKPNTVISLSPSENMIDLITIKANNEYLYNLLKECRNKLKKNKIEYRAKTFLNVVSFCNQKPVEYIEAFYNSDIKQAAIEELHFKNGISTLGTHDEGGYFFNLNISRAMVLYSLISDESRFPNNPLHFSKRKLKKNYWLSREFIGDKNICITFEPKKDKHKHFSGKIWMDKTNYNILEIELHSDHREQTAFAGVGASELNSIDYKLSFSFLENENQSTLNHIKLDYEANLTSGLKKDSTSSHSKIPLKVKSEAIAHLFDYESEYPLPKFRYIENMDDYRVFTVPPQDATMWTAITNSNQVKLTQDKKKVKQTLISDGKRFSNELPENEDFFKSNFMNWERESRVFIKKEIQPVKPSKIKFVNGMMTGHEKYLIDKLNIDTQIYFDYIGEGSNLVYTTASILDNYTSYNYLDDTPEIRCYTNIYFDIAEIYRQELVKRIEASDKSHKSLDRIYDEIISELTIVQKEFKKDCYAGSSNFHLKKWNKYVAEQLGISNLIFFAIL